jgi:hypothetical protein
MTERESRRTGGAALGSVAARLRRLDWPGIEQALWGQGYARTPPVLAPRECRALAALWGDERRFRARVDMARLRFGVGEYRYFARPLPALVAALRAAAFEALAPLANRWMEALGAPERFPPRLPELLARCAACGQTRPTPLLLRYEAGGYNCLHRDLYGDVVFPLQLTCFLSRRGIDYEGGEFLLLEQRPRAQSRAEAVAAEQGELVIFPTAVRPARTARGVVRLAMRHGVSRVTRGERYALGIIFHDAR